MQPLRISLAFLLAGLGGLSGCQQRDSGSTPHPRQVAQYVPTPDELIIYLDICSVQRLEHGHSVFQRADDSVTFGRDGHEFRFRNVHAYRADLKHRMDSMMARGARFNRFDTTYVDYPSVRDEAPSPSDTFTVTVSH